MGDILKRHTTKKGGERGVKGTQSSLGRVKSFTGKNTYLRTKRKP